MAPQVQLLGGLEPKELDALTVLALLVTPRSPREWLPKLAQAGVKTRGAKPFTLKQLQILAGRAWKLGLVAHHDGEKDNRYSVCDVTPVLEQAVARKRLGVLARKLLPPPQPTSKRVNWASDTREHTVRQLGCLRVAFALADQEAVIAALVEVERYDYADNFIDLVGLALGDDPPTRWLELIPDKLRLAYLRNTAIVALNTLTPPPQALSQWVRAANTRKLTLDALRLFALRDDSESIAALGKLPKWGAETAAILQAFARGDYEAAAAAGDAGVAAMKGRKHPRFENIEGFVHVLAQLVTMGTKPERATSLRASLRLAVDKRGPDQALYRGVTAFLEASSQPGGVERAPREMFVGRDHKTWQDYLFQGLGQYWLGLPVSENIGQLFAGIGQRAELHGYPGPAREFEALAELAKAPGTSPPEPNLARAYTRREAWEAALEVLESVVEFAASDASAGADAGGFREHIVWEVALGRDALDINVKHISSARSRKGKALSIPQLMEAKLACLSDADRRVIAAAKIFYDAHHGSSSYGVPSLYGNYGAFAALVGHPHVRRTSGTPLTLVAGQPRLRSRTEDGVTRVELFPPELAYKDVHLIETEPDHIEVYVYAEELAPVFALFERGQVLTVPASGRARLLDSLAGLTTNTALHIEGEESLRGRAVEADPRLVMRLRWDGSTFVAEAKVAPFGLAGPHLRPGDGAVELVARVGEELLSCTRDPSAENRRFDTLLEACPTLASHPEDEGRWEFFRLELALEALLELHACEPELVLTWPKGRRLNPPKTLTAKDIRVQVNAETNWLELDVGVSLDEDRVLGFEQLLAARAGKRFLALGDDEFLVLSSELRRRVDALESLGPVEEGKIAAPTVALSLIEELVGDEQALHADAETRKRLEQLRAITAKTPRLPRTFQATLRDYQLEGYRWLARLADAGLGAILADDMGLGKTIQSLALLLRRAKLGPALVVAPTSVVDNWRREAERFAPQLRCSILAQASDRAELLAEARAGSVILTSYGLLANEIEALAEIEFGTLVFDEAHALKNARSRRSKAARKLRGGFRLALTGTPLENHLGELWSVMQSSVPGLLGTQKRFEERFVRPISQGQRERARQLRAMLQPFVLRRTKAQVLDELPPRTEITIRVEPTPEERAFYEALRRRAVARTSGLGDAKGGKAGGKARLQILAELTRLRQAAVDPRLIDPENGPPGAKLDVLIERLVDLRAEGHRALVFSQFLGSLASVRARLDEAGIAHLGFEGSTPAAQRSAAVDAFQAGEADVFVMSLKAGGVGINLTGADYVIHLDPWWNPAVEDQATGRAHRMGQQRPVTVYRLVTLGTIEEQILELHAKKRDLADDLLAGLDQAKKLDLAELRALLLAGG